MKGTGFSPNAEACQHMERGFSPRGKTGFDTCLIQTPFGRSSAGTSYMQATKQQLLASQVKRSSFASARAMGAAGF